MTDETHAPDDTAPPPGEADTPEQAKEDTAPEIRRLRHGDDAPQSDVPRSDA